MKTQKILSETDLSVLESCLNSLWSISVLRAECPEVLTDEEDVANLEEKSFVLMHDILYGHLEEGDDELCNDEYCDDGDCGCDDGNCNCEDEF